MRQFKFLTDPLLAPWWWIGAIVTSDWYRTFFPKSCTGEWIWPTMITVLWSWWICNPGLFFTSLASLLKLLIVRFAPISASLCKFTSAFPVWMKVFLQEMEPDPHVLHHQLTSNEIAELCVWAVKFLVCLTDPNDSHRFGNTHCKRLVDRNERLFLIWEDEQVCGRPNFNHSLFVVKLWVCWQSCLEPSVL